MKLFSTAVLIALVASCAVGSTYSWNGSVSNVWSVAGNWTPLDGGTSFPQGAGNTAVFGSSASVITTGLLALPSVEVTGTLSLTIPSGTLSSPNGTVISGPGGLKIADGKIKFLQGGAPNTFAGAFEVAGTAKAMISGSDKVIPSGGLKMSGGTLQFMADDAVVSSCPVTLAGGEVNFSTCSETLGVVTVAGNGTISDYNFGADGACNIHFADSSAATWTPGAILSIEYLASGGIGNIYFGTNASGLTAAQLAQIQFVELDDGFNPTGNISGGMLDSSGRFFVGFPQPVEPGTAGLLVMGSLALIRRRSSRRSGRSHA